MGSLLKRKLIVTAALAMLSVISQSLHAENVSTKPMESAADSDYPQYPPATPAQGMSPELVARGEYLAKMGDCIACHTDMKAGTPAYAGGLPIATSIQRTVSEI